jgi:hypothetical protein
MQAFRTHLRGVVVMLALCGVSAGTLFSAQRTTHAGDCESNRETGTPLFFPPRKDIAYGISMKRSVFLLGERVPVYVWIDNHGSTAFRAGSCDMFSNWNVAVWNSSEHRLLSTAEQRHIVEGESCDSNVLIEVKPHSCLKLNEIDAAFSYPLVPGQYRIAELPWPPYESASQHAAAHMPSATKSLTISVTDH